MNNRPTPRTEAVMVDPLSDWNDLSQLARKLEIELSEVLRERDEARGAIKSTIAWIKERRSAHDFTTMGMVEERLLKALEVRDDLAEETK